MLQDDFILLSDEGLRSVQEFKNFAYKLDRKKENIYNQKLENLFENSDNYLDIDQNCVIGNNTSLKN